MCETLFTNLLFFQEIVECANKNKSVVAINDRERMQGWKGVLRARSAELQSKQTRQKKRKMSVDRQTLCAPLLDLIIGKRGNLIFKTSKKNATREIKNIYCGDGVSSNILAVMRCLLIFFVVLRCSKSPKVPLLW